MNELEQTLNERLKKALKLVEMQNNRIKELEQVVLKSNENLRKVRGLVDELVGDVAEVI